MEDQDGGLGRKTRVEDQGEGQEAECQRRTLQVACTMRTGRGSSTGSCRVAWTSGMLGQVGRVHLKRNKQEALDSGLNMRLPKRGEGRSWLKLDGSGVLSAEPRRAQNGTWCRGINESPGPTFTERPCPPQGPAGSQAVGGTGRSCAACGRLACEKAAGLPWFRTPSRVELGKDLELVPGAPSSCLLRVCWE